MKYDLGRDLAAYLDTMETEMDKLGDRISDSDCMIFLLKTLPEHFVEINENLTKTLLAVEDDDYDIIEAKQGKNAVAKEIDDLETKNTELADKIRELKRSNQIKKGDSRNLKKSIV